MGVLTDHLHDLIDKQEKQLEKLHTVEGILMEPETDDAHYVLSNVYQVLGIQRPDWLG